jgi:PmbA protein
MSQSLDTISQLLEKARAMGADAADAVLFETTDVSTSQRMGKREGIERSENKALGLRAFIGNQQAIVSTTDMLPAALSELAERAVAMARATPPDAESTLAPEACLARTFPELDLYDGIEPDVSWLNDQCREAEEAALSVPGITNSEGADAYYGLSRISLAIHNGQHLSFAHSYQSTHFSLSVSVLAGTGTGMERDYEFTSTRHRADLQAASGLGLEASRRALKRLNPRKAATCQAPVIFDPRMSRTMLSVLSGAISGSSISRGSSFLKDSLHTRIMPASIRIVDDPHLHRGLGSKPFDAEGVRNQRRAIVENGELTTWLLDVRSANELGLATTGHASRGVSSPPSPASTNLYMEPGTASPEELIRDIKSGFYVTETFGMGINTITGDYSQGAAGFWIENGELAYPVSEVTIAGQLRDMFAGLTPANDLTFRYSTNAPTLRIESMTVAGV